MNHRRLCGMEREVKRKALVDRFQDLRVAAPCNLPIAVPDSTVRITCAGQPRACAGGALRMKEFVAVQIAQREVRKIQVAHFPSAGCFGVAIDTQPKKRQLKPKTMPVSRLDVAGVIPPVRLKVWG